MSHSVVVSHSVIVSHSLPGVGFGVGAGVGNTDKLS